MTQADTVNSLPLPDKIAAAHSHQVKQCVLDKIASTGCMSFTEYMDTVLYAPGLGYYSAGSTKLGADGDFITAPEISDLFSQSIAHAIVPALEQIQYYSILEVGAGSGKMAAAILAHLESLNKLPLHYYILELSADLRSRQQQFIHEAIPELAARVSWLDSIPENLNAVVLANELLDAMPVVRFRKEQQGISVENVVEVKGELQLAYTQDKNTTGYQRAMTRIEEIQHAGIQFEPGYISEINFNAEDWLASIAGSLNAGIILLVDYGYPQHEYYHPQRNKGTLTCFYRHRHHDNPLLYPGLQDLTAHIDFTALADCGVKKGLSLLGYTTQSHFLFGAGIAQLAQQRSEQFADADVVAQIELASEVKKLTMPYEMGEIVKVIGFSKNCSPSLAAFQFKDMRDHL